MQIFVTLPGPHDVRGGLAREYNYLDVVAGLVRHCINVVLND